VSDPILCVDIGGTSTKAAVLFPNCELRFVNSIPTQPDSEAFLSALLRLIELTRENLSEKTLKLGVAVAGFLDAERTRLFHNPNIPWLEGFPLKDRLKEHFPDSEIELEVDSNAATMAEYMFGSGRGKSRFLCLTCGTGLGVGMTIEGVPLRFAYGCMGDIGHTIVQRDGPRCPCGGRGCAEILISAVSLMTNYHELTAGQRVSSLRDIIDASKQGDMAALSVLGSAGEWLGVAAASMANAFFPDHIAIAGGLSAAGEVVLAAAERAFRESACTLAKSSATFSLATMGSTATLIGAGWPYFGE
jgi:glucokinase